MDSMLLLQEFLKCSVCLGTLVNPMSLPCTHTFCQECLVQTFIAVGRLAHCRCPICRAPLEMAKRNSSISCLVEEYRAVSGDELPEDRSKERQYGGLDVAELLAVENDKRSIPVENVRMGEEELEEEAGAEVEGYGIEMAMPTPLAPPEHELLARISPHFWPRIVSGEWERGEAFAAEMAWRECRSGYMEPEEVDSLMQALRESGLTGVGWM
ncbi:E3 ubiquitin ISG15 ligase [Rhizina undulata]